MEFEEQQTASSHSRTGRSPWESFTDGKYTDVTFLVGGEEIKLHKVIMARSAVFATMFDGDFEEAKSNQVVISDIEPREFKELVRYLYTGQVENLREMAMRLSVCANKYCLDELVRMCETAIAENLEISNAAEALELAKLLRMTSLEIKSKKFIKEHALDVVTHNSFRAVGHDVVREIALTFAEELGAPQPKRPRVVYHVQ